MKISDVKVTVNYCDGSTAEKTYCPENNFLTVPKKDFDRDIDYIDVFCSEFTGQAGGDGYFVVPNIATILDNENAAQIYFRKRPDMEHVFTASNMPIYAVCNGENSLLAICEGMGYEYELVAEVKDGVYKLFPRYRLNEMDFYEDITIRFIPVCGTDWCAIARRYRQYQLERGACVPIRERVKSNPVLKDAVKGIEIRCRLAMKEGFPDGIPKDQTEENEPPIHVFATFERMEEVIDALHEAGCENANFCLVGWNKSGHDGRFPDLFPVEPLLGGEDALRHLIEKAKKMGYLISAHTNPMISSTISKRLDQGDFQRDADGSNYIWGLSFCGDCHVLCDKQSYEHYVKEDMKAINDLGFRGIHFFDQITIFRPRPCFDKNHPLNRKQVVEYRSKILSAGRAACGASASEGGFDFCIGSYDWAMYPVITYKPKLPEICDCTIPLWYIVYHGIVLYNAFPKTVNSMFKGPEYDLIPVEYGARPLAYLHGRVFEYENEPNFTCTTDQELKECARTLGAAYKQYSSLSDLQYEFFEEHRQLEDGVIYTRYSDGTVIIINYNDKPYEYGNEVVNPKSFLRTRV